MTTEQWLAKATKQLNSADIPTARLDCLVLLEDLLHKDRAHLLAHPEIELTVEQEKALNGQIEQRTKHIPLAYIRGKTEFYGRDFIITKDVLEPRPETETMIDLLKKIPRSEIKTIIDVGTGSGAIAITAALELITVQAIAIDIDQKCLDVARKNCELHKATVDLRNNDLLADMEIPENCIILANLPYVPNSYTINDAAMNEPRLAIFGGEDGLDLYRTMFKQITESKIKPNYVLTESLPFQHQALELIAHKNGYTQKTQEDFIQVFESS